MVMKKQVDAVAEDMVQKLIEQKLKAEAEAKAQQQAGTSVVNTASPAVKRRIGPLSRTRPAATSTSSPNKVTTAAPAATPVTPAAQLNRPRPGPKSKTKTPDYDDEDEKKKTGPIQRTPVIPKPEAVQKVDATRKLSGKDLSQLKSELSRKNRLSTPSAPAPPKRKASSKKSSAKKKKQESDSEEEEYPEYILNLPDVRLRPDEYFPHIPSKSKNCRFFNNTVKCNGCEKSFPAHNESQSLKGILTIKSPQFYSHCLTKCEPYMKKYMKSCDDCSHRYLDAEEFSSHRRGQCKVYKERVHKLKLKMPWMPTQQFMDLLSSDPKHEMCCEACHEPLPAYKKGNDYSPSLEMQCHMLDACQDYIDTGKSRS